MAGEKVDEDNNDVDYAPRPQFNFIEDNTQVLR